MNEPRLQAAQWARDILQKNPLILDTETTGLDDGEIVQIAVINQEGAPQLDTLVRPSRPIPEAATAVHGITDTMVAGAPRWPMVLMLLRDLVHERHVAIYNADFDLRMIRETSRRYREPERLVVAGWHDAMEWYAAFWGDWNDYHRSYRWQRLAAACAQQEIPEPEAPAHSALGDCLRTLALLRKMAAVAKEVHP